MGGIVVTTKMSYAIALIATGMLIANRPAMSAEITEEMRTFARMFTSLEARDLKGYCTVKHGSEYAAYLGRVCQSAVQNRLKRPEECSQNSIAQQAKDEAAKCLAMPPDEFDKAVARGSEVSKAFVKEMASQGVDGEKLLKDEREKRR